MTLYEEYLKARKDDELVDLFRIYIYSGLTKTKELGHLPLLIQNKLDMLNKEFIRRIKKMLVKDHLSLKSDAELMTLKQKYADSIMFDVSIHGTTPQETMNEYTAIIVELNRRGLS